MSAIDEKRTAIKKAQYAKAKLRGFENPLQEELFEDMLAGTGRDITDTERQLLHTVAIYLDQYGYRA